MTIDARSNHTIRLIINTLGLSCLGGAIFLQILVFSSILEAGYFKAIEANPFILSIEIALTAFSAIYFLYLYQKMIRSNLKP